MNDADPKAATIAAPLASANDAAATIPIEAKRLGARYEILGMLGAGAMGTVYRARDLELDEVVALKILKRELASAASVERFRREVKLARRVTHANVARTFDIGEDGGDRFLTMEYVEGEMLGTLLARMGRLPTPLVIRLALDLCSGLAAAHAVNVIHRDLKPENVIVARDGHAVITDFGIARGVAGVELGNTIGGIAGTPAYMAPEQVEGKADLDARADLYALGTMVYELLTGQAAWQGDSVISVAAGRLLRPPPDARTLLPDIPAPLAELVLKLMARQREDRPASAADTGKQLEILAARITSAPSNTAIPLHPLSVNKGPGARSIAVLPILNAGTAEDTYLVDCVVEDLIDLLSVVPGLLVRPRGETARFVDPARDVRAIGRALGSDVVVDGSLRRIGETVRASFRLIAVEDGFQLWARRLDRAPAHVLSIADDAAQAIASALTAQAGESTARATNAEAEDLYLRGRSLMRRQWTEVLVEATSLLARAHESAPDDLRIAASYAHALARIYGAPSFGRDAAERARSLAEKVSAADPRQAEAKLTLGVLHLHNQEADAAVRYFRQAQALSPSSVEALDLLARIMADVGRVEEALSLLRRAIDADVDNLQARYQLGRIAGIANDQETFRASLGQMPSHPGDAATWFLIQARDIVWRRDRDGAARLKQAVPGAPLPPKARRAVDGMLDSVFGNVGGALRTELFDRLLPVDTSRPPRRAAMNAQLRAEMLGALGERAATLDALRAADANSLFDIVWLERCPLFDELRSDPELITIHGRVTLRARRVVESLDLHSKA